MEPRPALASSTLRFTEDKAGYYSNTWQEQWALALVEAKKTGWGYNREKLISQGAGNQISLDFTESKSITMSAGDRGFYTVPGRLDKEGSHCLSRFDAAQPTTAIGRKPRHIPTTGRS